MLVDHERVLLDLKRTLTTKPSHGADALLAEIARLEAKHQLEEGLPEKALRLYGVIYSDSTLPAASRASEDHAADGADDQPASIGAGSHRPERTPHADRGNHAVAAAA